MPVLLQFFIYIQSITTDLFLCRSQNELQKQKQESENLSNKLTVIEQESEELKSNLRQSRDECQAVKQEHQALLEWKKNKENLINQTEAAQQELTDKIITLEGKASRMHEANNELQVSFTNIHPAAFQEEIKRVCFTLQDKISSTEADKASLSAHIDALKGELLMRSTELEEKEHQYQQLQLHVSEAAQKHDKDLENAGKQLAQLQGQVRPTLWFRLKKPSVCPPLGVTGFIKALKMLYEP